MVNFYRSLAEPTGRVPLSALECWRQQTLSAESQSRFVELMHAQRYFPDDEAGCDALLDAFLETLTEAQLTIFARMLRELTQQVH